MLIFSLTRNLTFIITKIKIEKKRIKIKEKQSSVNNIFLSRKFCFFLSP